MMQLCTLQNDFQIHFDHFYSTFYVFSSIFHDTIRYKVMFCIHWWFQMNGQTSVLTQAEIMTMEMDIVLSRLNERKCLFWDTKLLHWFGITIEIDLFWAGIGVSEIIPEVFLSHLTNQNNTLNCADPKFCPCTFHLGSKGLKAVEL